MKRYQKPLFILLLLLAAVHPGVRGAAFCGLIALCVGRLAAVPVAKLEQMGCPRWLGGAFLVLGAAGLTLFGAFCLLSLLCTAVTDLTAQFPNFATLFLRMEELSRPLTGSIGTVIRDGIALLSHQSEKLPGLLASSGGKLSRWAASSLPKKLLFLFMTLLASYYAAVDWPQVRRALGYAIPSDWERSVHSLLSTLAKGGIGWLRIQGKLAGMQFLLLMAGFFLLGVPSPILSGGLTALADAFPLLGTGTILVPWSVLLWLTGEARCAAGMGMLWVLSWALRAVLEPRLVGHQAGISPFFTVLGLYLGLRCFGVAGMVAGAVLLSAAGNFVGIRN